MKLHYFDGSTTCRPIVMFAHEAGIPLELVPVDLFAGEQTQPAFLAKNPNGKVPVLEDDGFLLTESSAILKYLAEVSGSPAYPADPRGRARVNAQMDWFNTGFYRTFGYGIVYPVVMPHTAHAGPGVQEAVTGAARHEAQSLLRILNDHMLSDGGAFLGGAQPNLADFLGVAFTTIGEMIGEDFSAHRRVVRWIAAMKARPSWAAANRGFEAWRDATLARRAA
ncbi:glutathione S-transferase family protein [Roseomonas eburnea]|uniref:Glutathione S-transferase family protein n=1 Tax=Neoroseomonas eburnea TaxID=1346889 RepID=A0A9X9XBX0_9PROT|nr:glutathione S-transferase family protein [Neoroseomonas eburnea]MBR0681206.1 glutathione S-transferase family protein [Neoroseomonas eburnea]